MSTTRKPRSRRSGARGGARLGRPPGSSREETVARLLKAAQGHFGEHGYAGARLTEIARDAGITHSSIYQYFPSKLALYVAAFEAAQGALLPRYAVAIAFASTLKEKLAAIFRASADAHREDPTITPFLASVPLELRRHPELAKELDTGSSAMMAAMRILFEEARQRGEIPADAADLDLLIGFVGAAMGIGLFSHGLRHDDMGPPLELFLRAMDGRFFSS